MSVPYTWNFTADGNGASVQSEHKNTLEIIAYGTWGGGTLTLQFSPDSGTTWINVVDMDGSALSLTANGVMPDIVASSSDLFRAVLSGATTPSLTVTLREVVGG